MNSSEYTRLIEIASHRKLKRSEEEAVQQFLSEHPEEQGRWEEEQRLNQCLRALPDVPVSSNFSARVISEVAAQARPAGRRIMRPDWIWSGRWARPAMAFSLVVLVLAGAGLNIRRTNQVHERAESIAAMSRVAGLPPVDLLQDFEAIQRLSQAPRESDAAYLLSALEY